MPIKDLSDNVRLPRLGKIKLGTKDPERGFPRKSEFFVFPKDHSDYKKLVELYGETPKELPILIPVEDEETWATQYYRAYNQTYGLVCKGDGESATRMIDIKTGQLPDAKKPGTVKMQEIPCAGKNCPEYQEKKCKEVMNLRFILPEVPGLGIWQIDTSSKNSMLNINSCAKVIKRAFGRISMIPLKLTLEPIQVNNPETGRKQMVYVLNLRTDVTLAQLADAAREQAKMFMLEAPDLEKQFEIETEKDIEELWGIEDPVNTTTGEVKGKQQQPPPEPTEEEAEDDVPAPEPPSEKKKSSRNSETIKTIEQLARALKEDFGLSYQQQWDELNIKSWNDLAVKPSEAYVQIKASRE